MATSLVEEQVVLIDVRFFFWLAGRIGTLLKLQSRLKSDWGLDKVWCGAAAVYAKEVLGGDRHPAPCGLRLGPCVVRRRPRLLLPPMMRRRRGVIVLISSIIARDYEYAD